MKKITKIISLVLVFSLVCVMLVSCGKTLSGTYSSEIGGSLIGAGAKYTFKGNDVTITANFGVVGFEMEKSFDGTYEITENDEGELQITFTFGDDEASKYNGTVSFEENKEENAIIIGGIKYTKQ